MNVYFRYACTLLLAGFLLTLTVPQASAQPNRGGAAPLEQLPQELRDLTLRDYFIPSSNKAVGVIQGLEGKVVVSHGDAKQAYFGMQGDPVYERDKLVTLAQSRCRIRFVDEDVVTMAAETEFSVESFEDQRGEGRKTSLFRMLKGKAMFYAMRLFRYRDARFTLSTPTTTIGVRGTKFGVHVYYVDGSGTASRPMLVADAGSDIAPYLAQAGQGRSVTDCFSEDGVVYVDGQPVGPGQMYDGRTRQVIPTPPGVIRSFRQETEIGTGGATRTTEGGEETSPAPATTSVTGGLAPATAEIVENIADTVAEKTGSEGQVTSPQKAGYFAAMLTSFYPSTTLEDVFIQFEDHRDYEVDVAKGLGLASDQSSIETRPSYGADPLLTRIVVNGIGDSGDLGSSSPINHTVLGSNGYMEWGHWTATTPVTIGINEYSVDNKAYFLLGQATENLTTVRTLGNVTYSGSAWGTYWTSAGGIDMTGTFSTDVNMSTGALTNFDLSVSGGGRSASIQDATGQIYDYGNPANNSCSHFDINLGAPGVWQLNGAAPTNMAAQGSLYGPNGEHIGGIWGMKRVGEGAVGVFQGSR